MVGGPKKWAEELEQKWGAYDPTGVKEIKWYVGPEVKEAKIEAPKHGNVAMIFTHQSMGERPRSPYLGRSPIEYASDLLLRPGVYKGIKTIKPMERSEALELLGKIQRQEVDMGEPGVGGQSLATKGFRAGKTENAILTASMPGADQVLYNDILFMALMHDFHFAITWEQYWGNVWLANWLRELLVGVVGGAKPFIITGAPKMDEHGQRNLALGSIGFAQTAEVFLCLALGVEFQVVFIQDLFNAFRPLLALAKKKDWVELGRRLDEGVPPDFLTHTDAAGKNALFTLIREAAREGGRFDPCEIVQKLLEKNADPSQPDFYGWNSLHLAARFSTPKTIEVLVKFSPGLLNKKDAEGRSPLYRAIKHQNNATEEKLKELGATLDESERESLQDKGAA